MPAIRKLLVFAALLTLLSATFPSLSTAQMSLITGSKDAAEESSNLKPLIEQAKENGMTIVVISPERDSAARSTDTGMSMTDQGLMLREQIRDIIRNVPNIWSQMLAALRNASPDGTYNWLFYAVAVAVGGILVGAGISWIVRRLMMKHFQRMFNPEPKDRAEKIGFLLFRASMISVNCVLMFVSAIIVALVLDYGHEPSRATILVIVGAYVAYWVFRAVIFFNIIAHDLPNHRMINLEDEPAKVLQHDWRNSMIIVIVTFAFCAWMEYLGVNPNAHKLFLVLSMAISVGIFGYLTIKHRKPVAGIILGAGNPAIKPLWRRLMASYWHVFALAYLIISFFVSSYRVIMDLPSAVGTIAAPMIALIASLPIYGIVLIMIDKFYEGRRVRFQKWIEQLRRKASIEQTAEQIARAEAMANDPDADTQTQENIINKTNDAQYPVFKPLFKPLIEQAAGIFILLAALGFVLGTWDVEVGESGNPITAFMDTIAVALIAWLLFRAVAIYVDDKLESEGIASGANPAELDDEPGGHETSRLGTLLPLLRNVMIVTIILIAGMIVLSNLGVDIAPLFAGAGVIGLAVGFGAQTMIRDIFSGGFFLFDDAFRKGEYIELGNIRGTVEKISLRSFQLRHHNGPLHTIPFGEITQLTNYSRDWVIMKLPLRVTYDTDVEKVRKLVKKLGQQLLEDPEVGKNFLQPLKSQGVVQMEDSAMIIRVKFMTLPGDQWTTRKVVYAAIRELFEREGIRFASREVTVRIADEAGHEITEKEKEAAAAAARRIVDDEAEAPLAVDDR